MRRMVCSPKQLALSLRLSRQISDLMLRGDTLRGSRGAYERRVEAIRDMRGDTRYATLLEAIGRGPGEVLAEAAVRSACLV